MKDKRVRIWIAPTIFGLTWGLLVLGGSVHSKDFYVDPQHGAPENDGSAERPWHSLQQVVDRGLVASREWESLPHEEGMELVPKNPDAPVKGGDTIWLREGNYGELEIGGYYNRETITIAAEEGHVPRFRQIRVQSGAHWVLKGLHVQPDSGKGDRPRTLIRVEAHDWGGPVHHIRVTDCVVRSAEDVSEWSRADWNERACNGLSAEGRRITLDGNRIENVDFGISVGASDSLVEGNLVKNFAGDGMRGLGDRMTFQYNTVKNCYDVNDNHDDGFQSWSNGPQGVGRGTVSGIVLRGNTIINYEDRDQPHRGTLQGIGCFDGMFKDWVIENNVIVTDHWHGITLLGARGCRIVNNTVVDPNEERPGPPWIRIGPHKNGTASEECTVRNNLASALNIDRNKGITTDHNLIVEDPVSFFADLSALDLRPTLNSGAIDAGSSDLAPETDIVDTSRPQGGGVDVGAYELPIDLPRP